MHKTGQRGIFANLTCERVSNYETQSRFGNVDSVKLIYRYQFYDVCGFRYVYSGKPLVAVRAQMVVTLRATVKCGQDSFGFCRLSRPVIVGRGDDAGFL
jgi:hypothetical protein